MAGLAALMTRKKRDRRRELELKLHKPENTAGSITEIRLPLTGKEAQEALQKKAAHETIKKILNGKELLHQKSKSFDALSQFSYNDNDDDPSNGGNAYSLIYIGLILLCIGAVITFVGLGEKGFKTVELKLIGPILCLVGFTCITLKIIQCTFPHLCQYPAFLKTIVERRQQKLGDSKADKSNLMEKGSHSNQITNPNQIQNQNGYLSNSSSKNSPLFVSPRVTLQSAKKPQRPHSTIPNYIEDTSEDDDFDLPQSRGKSRLDQFQSKLYNNSSSTTFVSSFDIHNQKQIQVQQREGGLGGDSSPKLERQQSHKNSRTISRESNKQNEDEIVLNPKGLML